MQNKANVKWAKINVSYFMTSIYAKMDNWLFRQTNPIQTQFDERAQNDAKCAYTRIKNRNAAMGHEKQSQFKPNFKRAGR